MTDPMHISTNLENVLEPNDKLHENVVLEIAGGNFPVKLNGKTVGTGKLMPNGSIEMEVFDEGAKRMLNDGSIKELSVDNTSRTITAIS